jgi:hypothetical protein
LSSAISTNSFSQSASSPPPLAPLSKNPKTQKKDNEP